MVSGFSSSCPLPTADDAASLLYSLLPRVASSFHLPCNVSSTWDASHSDVAAAAAAAASPAVAVGKACSTCAYARLCLSGSESRPGPQSVGLSRIGLRAMTSGWLPERNSI